MATAAAQARLLSLTMYKSDLEFKLMSLMNQRQCITYQVQEITKAYADAGCTDSLESDPTAVYLQQIEKNIDAEQTVLQTQIQEVNEEKQSIEELVKNNIKKDFKINFGS